jgi:hypothetical protein
MYAAPPEKVRKRLRLRAGQKRRGKTPLTVLREQAARRRLQAYQYGAYDNAESTRSYESGEQFFGALQEELQKDFFPARPFKTALPSWWLGGEGGSFGDAAADAEPVIFQQQTDAFGDDDFTAGGLGLHFKLKLPKFIRKMKPLKLLGKVAPVAAMVIPGLNVATAAAIGAGGAVLRKGTKAKFFKDILGGAAVAGGGRVALKAVRKIAPKALSKFTQLLKGKSVAAATEAAQAAGILPPTITPPVQAQLDEAAAASQAQMAPLTEAAAAAISPPPFSPLYSPSYAPTETAAAYTPPDEQVPGTTDTGAPAEESPLKKLLVPGLIAAAFLL